MVAVTVREATDGATILRGQVLIAPGNRHTLVKRSGARYFVEVRDGPLVCRHRPSVDVLFRSVAQEYGAATLAVILTGMGQDGLHGCQRIRDSGGQILVQDEATSVVWGMPGFVVNAGLADAVLPIQEIGPAIVRRTREKR